MIHICRFAGHHRRRDKIRHVGNWNFRSICRWCGVSLVRLEPKRWAPLQLSDGQDIHSAIRVLRTRFQEQGQLRYS